MDIIPKKDLIDAKWYVGAATQRGMPIGAWYAKEQVFICIQWEWAGPRIYKMEHIEDKKDNRYVCFEPVKLIETPK